MVPDPVWVMWRRDKPRSCQQWTPFSDRPLPSLVLPKFLKFGSFTILLWYNEQGGFGGLVVSMLASGT